VSVGRGVDGRPYIRDLRAADLEWTASARSCSFQRGAGLMAVRLAYVAGIRPARVCPRTCQCGARFVGPPQQRFCQPSCRPSMRRPPRPRPLKFTMKKREVAASLIQQGYAFSDVARAVGVSLGTVSAYVSSGLLPRPSRRGRHPKVLRRREQLLGLLAAGVPVSTAAVEVGLVENTIAAAIEVGLLPKPARICRRCGSDLGTAVVVCLGCQRASLRSRKERERMRDWVARYGSVTPEMEVLLRERLRLLRDLREHRQLMGVS
jgi:DNA-binding transcriptional MerR regulator